MFQRPPPQPAGEERVSAGDVLVRTEPLGGSPLARALLEGRAGADWLEPRPRGRAGWGERAARVREGFSGDAWLDALAPAIAPAGPAAERLRRAAADGVIVTTGQQPGLFGGPIYTWSKALSAIALADALEESTGLPVAPLFWAATDDADFAEASWTTVAVPGGYELLRMGQLPTEHVPMAEVPLEDISSLLAKLERGAGSAGYAAALEQLRAAYAPGETVGSAYVRLLRAVLEPLGMAVLDAWHPAVRRAASPLLRRALGESARVESALRERTAAIAAAGFTPQVAEVAGLTLVFTNERGAKRRVAASEATALASAAADTALSPNVLLRPVVERAILPTVAYVAGPGELAYFAQVGAVAAALGAARPLAVPRWSCTIIEPRVARLLERYDLVPEDLASPTEAESRLARGAVPTDVTEALVLARAEIARFAERLRGAAARGEGALVPSPVVDGAERDLQYRVDRLERRLLAAVKRREAEAMRDIGTLRGSLYPAGKRQERALNFIPLLARHGPALLERMRERAGEHAAALVGVGASREPAGARA